MPKDEEILTGKLTNMDSGENWNVEFKPFFTDAVLMAIVKVEKTKLLADDDDPESIQIIVECKALDSIGFVYNLDLIFMPEAVAERDRIIADMKTDTIFMAEGRYCISQKELIVNINNPKYLPLPPSFDEEEVREIFKGNDRPLKKIQ
jgi:hypothetical protein